MFANLDSEMEVQSELVEHLHTIASAEPGFVAAIEPLNRPSFSWWRQRQSSPQETSNQRLELARCPLSAASAMPMSHQTNSPTIKEDPERIFHGYRSP